MVVSGVSNAHLTGKWNEHIAQLITDVFVIAFVETNHTCSITPSPSFVSGATSSLGCSASMSIYDHTPTNTPSASSVSGVTLDLGPSVSMTMSTCGSSTNNLTDNSRLCPAQKKPLFNHRRFKLSMQKAVRQRLLRYAGHIDPSLSSDIEASIGDSIELAMRIIARSRRVRLLNVFFLLI